MSAEPTFSSTVQRGQVLITFGAGGGADSAAGGPSSCSTALGFLELAGGVSGTKSESGADPGAENGESGGEPGPESGGEPGPESGDPGGDSGALTSSPETRFVAELRSEPKLNIGDAAAGGFADSVNPPKPPNNFPATDSSCFGAACAGGFDDSINPPKPLNSFPVTDSAACAVAAEGLAASVKPPRLIPPKPPKKLDSCLALAGDGWGLDFC